MFNDIISTENLLEAWKEFLKGKRNKKDVQDFHYQLSDNVVALHKELKDKTYKHGGYYAFNISDPKPRNIHKASVRDRLLHHAIYRQFYKFFDNTFIHDSYSCRRFRGTHKAVERFRSFAFKASRNNTKTLWILKCDVRKFFASIDHNIMLKILKDRIDDQDVLLLVTRVIESFQSTGVGKGLPLGNLTSQLLVNVYMDKFDQFVKHSLKAEYYIRYADDFVIMSRDKDWLSEILLLVESFLQKELALKLHPDKISIRTFASGVDFLGWVHFPDHRILRTVTKKRMFNKIKKSRSLDRLTSYRGLIEYGNTQKIRRQIDESTNY